MKVVRSSHSIIWIECCAWVPVISFSFLIPGLTSPHLTSPRLASPLLASPRLASPRLASPCFASRHALEISPKWVYEWGLSFSLTAETSLWETLLFSARNANRRIHFCAFRRAAPFLSSIKTLASSECLSTCYSRENLDLIFFGILS